MNPVHDRGSMDLVHMKVVHMDPVQSGGPWTPGPCFFLTPIILVIITLILFRLNRNCSGKTVIQFFSISFNRNEMLRCIFETWLFRPFQELSLPLLSIVVTHEITRSWRATAIFSLSYPDSLLTEVKNKNCLPCFIPCSAVAKPSRPNKAVPPAWKSSLPAQPQPNSFFLSCQLEHRNYFIVRRTDFYSRVLQRVKETPYALFLWCNFFMI